MLAIHRAGFLGFITFLCILVPGHVMGQNCPPRPGFAMNWCHPVQRPQVPMMPMPTIPMAQSFPIPYNAPPPNPFTLPVPVASTQPIPTIPRYTPIPPSPIPTIPSTSDGTNRPGQWITFSFYDDSGFMDSYCY